MFHPLASGGAGFIKYYLYLRINYFKVFFYFQNKIKFSSWKYATNYTNNDILLLLLYENETFL